MVCVQEFWLFVLGLDIQPEPSEMDNSVLKKAVACCEPLPKKNNYLMQTDTKPWLSDKGESQWVVPHLSGSGSILVRYWNSLPPLGHFAWHWSRQCTDSRGFYIAALSTILFLWFRQWRSRAYRILTLTWTSDFHCFGALGVGPTSRTRPHVRPWRLGVIMIVIVEPPKKCPKSSWLSATQNGQGTAESFITLPESDPCRPTHCDSP